MCGIICEIRYRNTASILGARVMNYVTNRGPNCMHSLEIKLDDEISVFFCGSVLWMQGPELIPQPVENEQSILLYNGDIFDESWDSSISDTQIIFEKLSNATEQSNIIAELKLIKGPFVIIYYDKVTKNLYFTRDRIGRSSLLLHTTDEHVIISNVLSRDYECVEIPASHIQILNLLTKRIDLVPWNEQLPTSIDLSLEDWVHQLKLYQSLPDDEFKFDYEIIDLIDKEGVIDYISSIAKETLCKLSVLNKILYHETIKEHVKKVICLLEKSVELRLKRQPNKCKQCLNISDMKCEHCTVGILFSGGLDCTVLAVLADKYLPREQSIDLINVAFRKDDNASYEVPDRITGKQSFLELRQLCPARKWVFIEVNVPKEEIDKCQESTIADLVYPRQTILDESLGTALWFAARGENGDNTSTSRVLLLGSGADELFGGYVRHRNAFKRHGWQGLNKELQLDWKRISFRNLSRDNRVICDHGRQPRMPYLDEDFTNYVLQLKPWMRCFPSEDMGIGIGDKLMLRLVALSLGLTDAVVLPKRALQFGSRIANKKEKGSDISKNFLNNKIIPI